MTRATGQALTRSQVPGSLVYLVYSVLLQPPRQCTKVGLVSCPLYR